MRACADVRRRYERPFAVHAGLKRSVGAGRDGCGIRRGRADRSSERFNLFYASGDILGKEFKLVNGADYYEYDNSYDVWKDRSGDQTYMDKVVKNAEPIRIVGIVQPVKDANGDSFDVRHQLSSFIDKTCRRRSGKTRK